MFFERILAHQAFHFLESFGNGSCVYTFVFAHVFAYRENSLVSHLPMDIFSYDIHRFNFWTNQVNDILFIT